MSIHMSFHHGRSNKPIETNIRQTKGKIAALAAILLSLRGLSRGTTVLEFMVGHGGVMYKDNVLVGGGVGDIIHGIDTTGVLPSLIRGNPDTCSDLIFTCDGRIPNSTTQNRTILDASWDAMVFMSQRPIFNKTCFAFFHLSSQHFSMNGTALNMVWGRLPAASLSTSLFPNAQYMLYMDSDAMLSSANYTPTSMYYALSYDGYGTNASFKHLTPSLIVNKPMSGWLCNQCRYFALEHGCFNSGALLWRRSKGMQLVLQRWWDSRMHDGMQNFFFPLEGNNTNNKRPFYGWSPNVPPAINHGHKMSEQNRLMYVFNMDADVGELVWPVPRQLSVRNISSCPEAIHFHTPCLQNDRAKWGEWDSSPSCFINHYADRKEAVHDVLQMMNSWIDHAGNQSRRNLHAHLYEVN